VQELSRLNNQQISDGSRPNQVYYGSAAFYFRYILKLFPTTTETEKKAIAAAAMTGFKKPATAAPYNSINKLGV
jgi:hypothetical protein